MADGDHRVLRDRPPDAWVDEADGDQVVLRRRPGSRRGWRLVREVTGKPLTRTVSTPDDRAKAAVLDRARDTGLPFRSVGHGWSPDGVAQLLRDEGLLEGRWDIVVYDGHRYHWYAAE